MCGIVGIYRRGGEGFGNLDPGAVLDRMNDALVHRGPDDAGTHVDAPLAFGMRRLSIIGVDNGHQPIFNETRSVAVVDASVPWLKSQKANSSKSTSGPTCSTPPAGVNREP